MKTNRELSAVGRLIEWCEVPSPPVSLVVAAHCGCDLSRLEREIRDHLNQLPSYRWARFGAFDYEDIRHLSGDPRSRRAILSAAELDPADFPHWNDYELVLRGLAGLGGLVLGGSSALAASRGLDKVCRVILSACDECDEPGLTARVDPDGCGADSECGLIAGAFLKWAGHPDRAVLEPRAAAEISRALGTPVKERRRLMMSSGGGS